MPGQPAPAFRGVDVHGKPVALADFRGKTVVLEWNNPNCPFVQKHYTSGNMQALQQKNTAAGVVWLAVNSTTESHSDYMAPAQLAAWFGEQKAAPTAIVMDPKGEIGRAYGAKVTPHMYVIDPKGTLVYAGAIDDKRSANPADVKTATNHVDRRTRRAGIGQGGEHRRDDRVRLHDQVLAARFSRCRRPRLRVSAAPARPTRSRHRRLPRRPAIARSATRATRAAAATRPTASMAERPHPVRRSPAPPCELAHEVARRSASPAIVFGLTAPERAWVSADAIWILWSAARAVSASRRSARFSRWSRVMRTAGTRHAARRSPA